MVKWGSAALFIYFNFAFLHHEPRAWCGLPHMPHMRVGAPHNIEAAAPKKSVRVQGVKIQFCFIFDAGLIILGAR